jgi:hypothetical protein
LHITLNTMQQRAARAAWSERDGPNRPAGGEPARRLAWKIVFCGTHLDTTGCHILTAARGWAHHDGAPTCYDALAQLIFTHRIGCVSSSSQLAPVARAAAFS